MYARVTKWDGGDGDAIRKAAGEINSRAASGPPEGVPAKGFLLLTDADNGRTLAVSLFESEEDYRQGDETLSQMSPPDDGFGKRGAVEKYDVAVDVRAD
jgi:hypothetical protein